MDPTVSFDPTHDQQATTADQTESQIQSHTAPWSSVPGLKIVDVEHPFIIQNIQKGMETLGGHNSISKVALSSIFPHNAKRKETDRKLQIVAPDGKDAVIGLYLHPEDRMNKPMMSHNVLTKNVVLHITVPKRTGRRRKKGSNGPYLDPAEVNHHLSKGSKDSETPISPRARLDDSTKHLLRTLQDNKDSYYAEPVGVIENTHRFRSMPDFVYSTTNSPFIEKMREHILPFQYDKLKQFAFDPSKGVQVNTDLIPPPSFSHITIPFIYSYRQNPAVKQTVNSAGHLTTTNTQTARKVSTHFVSYDVATVPSTPPSSLAPFETLDPPLQRTITQLQTLLATRPIWTRRAITNHVVSKEYASSLKQAFQYVSYMFRSGPWRDALVRLGLDPRTDPQYRIYQTLTFQLTTPQPDAPTPTPARAPGQPPPTTTTPKKWEDDRLRYAKTHKGRAPNHSSHLFDGLHADLDGKVWQVCDITDPLLRSILDPPSPSLRADCDIRSDGWFHNGTWAKARIIMKAKLTAIREGKVPVDADYARLLEIPDVLDKSNRRMAVLRKGSRREVQWAADIRTSAGSPAKRKPLGPSEGGSAARWRGVGEEVRGDKRGGETGGAGAEAGAGAVDPRVAESMREIERAGLGVEPGNDGDMDGVERMDIGDVDPLADRDGDGDGGGDGDEDADGDEDGDGDEEAVDDSDEMGE